ncbi:MAG: pyrroline-5-carboxylate reductase [Oscillospiraceae bacterium]|jgi:pyrroline-5-carboxylate reductase|nr:pyrroline-5-carboxylate reductase [Oscillospiraceae bacterium]
MKIGFIGVGNMGGALLRGILAGGTLAPSEVFCCDYDAPKAQVFASEFGITALPDAKTLAGAADLIVLAVKPDVAPSVLRSFADVLTAEKLVLSVVLGLSIADMTGHTGGKCRVIRVMPNTPALVGAGMLCVSFGDGISEAEKALAASLLTSCGEVEVMDEKYLARVTGLTGSSPAYVFMMLEAMADAAVRNGLPRAMSYRLAAQAVFGSAKMALEQGGHPGALKDNVCSPAGSTIEAVRVLEARGFRSALIEAIIACDAKAAESSK